jgi:hypothetical protein
MKKSNILEKLLKWDSNPELYIEDFVEKKHYTSSELKK